MCFKAYLAEISIDVASYPVLSKSIRGSSSYGSSLPMCLWAWGWWSCFPVNGYTCYYSGEPECTNLLPPPLTKGAGAIKFSSEPLYCSTTSHWCAYHFADALLFSTEPAQEHRPACMCLHMQLYYSYSTHAPEANSSRLRQRLARAASVWMCVIMQNVVMETPTVAGTSGLLYLNVVLHGFYNHNSITTVQDTVIKPYRRVAEIKI